VGRIAGVVLVVATGCGRLGFDAVEEGLDATPMSDGRVDGDTPGAFQPTTTEIIAAVDAPGSVVKLAWDGTSLFLSSSSAGNVVRIDPMSGSGTIFVTGLDEPGGLAFANGNLYIAERGTFEILQADQAGVTTKVAGTGNPGSEDGLAGEASFQVPAGLATDGTFLYVADRGASCSIRRITLATGDVETIAGMAGSCSHLDGIGTDARLSAPGGLALVGTQLYFSDTPMMRVLDLDTRAVTTMAGSTTPGFADGDGADAQFGTSLAEVTFDGAKLHIADSYNYRVRTLDRSNVVGTLVGTGDDTDDAGAIGTARIHEPDGVVFTPYGLFVASDLSITRVY
jgi:hypothetical protein